MTEFLLQFLRALSTTSSVKTAFNFTHVLSPIFVKLTNLWHTHTHTKETCVCVCVCVCLCQWVSGWVSECLRAFVRFLSIRITKLISCLIIRLITYLRADFKFRVIQSSGSEYKNHSSYFQTKIWNALCSFAESTFSLDYLYRNCNSFTFVLQW